MGSVGDCFDKAMCESFFATLECELLDRRRFKTQAQARMVVDLPDILYHIWTQPRSKRRLVSLGIVGCSHIFGLVGEPR